LVKNERKKDCEKKMENFGENIEFEEKLGEILYLRTD
jgi:hypothetical protein